MTVFQRVLFVAWQNPATRTIYPVARLHRRDTDPVWEFVYVRGAEEAVGFRPFPGLASFDTVYFSSTLPAFLGNRLMSLSRPDRPRFMERLGLDPCTRDEIPILARSQGLKETDTIEVFGPPEFDEDTGGYRYLFFVRGIRHVEGAEQRINALTPGASLTLQPEPDNVVDPRALIVHGDERLGYVPQTLVEDLHALRDHGAELHVTVERVNLAPAPIQLRLLCRLEAHGAAGFTPFEAKRYKPIPAAAELVDFNSRGLVH